MRIVLVLLLLAACSSPSLRFGKVTPVRVAVEGGLFDVYVLETDVQAIRVNMEMLPGKAQTVARAVAAIEQATGCLVLAGSISGDQALVNAKIRCEQAK